MWRFCLSHLSREWKNDFFFAIFQFLCSDAINEEAVFLSVCMCVARVRLASMRAVEVNKLNDLLDGHFELFDSLWSHE